MISVLYACDDLYIRQTIISMVSILEHNQHVKFYLISQKLSRDSINLLKNVMDTQGETVHIFEISDILPQLDLENCDRHPASVYAKLFMEKVISEKKVLYLDSDTVVNDSLEPLFDRNMEHELAAGVLMPYSIGVKQRANVASGEPYICDGVVLFNLEMWKKLHKSEECAEYIRDCGGKPPMLSEGTLNHVCQGMIGILEPKYNLTPSMLWYNPLQVRQLFKPDCYYGEKSEEIEQAIKEPVVIHYMNELYNRPWNEPCDHPWKGLYRKFHEDIFDDNSYKYQELPTQVKITRKLYEILPFRLFAGMYRFWHIMIDACLFR